MACGIEGLAVANLKVRNVVNETRHIVLLRLPADDPRQKIRDRFTRDFVTVMIDHIIVSNGLQVAEDNPHRIFNPFEDDSLEAMKQAFTDASDHFPVVLDLA